MRGLRSIIVLAVLAGLISAGPTALAAWNETSDGNGRSRATSMPSGSTPWTSVSNRSVTVSWSAASMPGGIPVDGYRVFRYNSSGTSVPVTGNCIGVVTSLNCTEIAMTPGTWRYAVAPVYKMWQGAQGPQSAPATVAAPRLNLTGSTTLTSLPGNLAGNVASFITGQTVTLRLDDPTSGTVVTGNFNPNSIPASGSANVTSIAIPLGVTNGTHTLYAVGSQGDVASATFTVNLPVPTPTSLELRNESDDTTGTPERDDEIRVVYSQRLSVNSICSAWNNDNVDQSLTTSNALWAVISDDSGATGNDVLSITTLSTCAGGFKFGTIDLGSDDFVDSTSYFGGSGSSATTAHWDVSSRRLTITLGNRIYGSVERETSSVTATYTPEASILGTNGQPITGTASRTARHF
jgi:hypothetical protein